MGIITEPPKELREPVQPQGTPSEPAPPSLSGAPIGRLDDDIANRNISDADLAQAAKRAYQDLLQQTGGPSQAAASLSIIQQSGALNAGMVSSLRGAMTVANGNADKFAEEIVKQRQTLAALMLPGTPGAPGTQPTTTAGPAGNANMSNIFDSEWMKPFKEFFDTIIKAFTGGKMNLATLLDPKKQPNGANPAAPASGAPAATASTGQTPATTSGPPATATAATPTPGSTPASAAATPAPVPAAATPAPPAAATPAATVADATVTRTGGTAYDVTPLPGGESPDVKLEDGSSNVRAVFGHNSDPPASAISVRNGNDSPVIQVALNSDNNAGYRYQNPFATTMA